MNIVLILIKKKYRL